MLYSVVIRPGFSVRMINGICAVLQIIAGFMANRPARPAGGHQPYLPADVCLQGTGPVSGSGGGDLRLLWPIHMPHQRRAGPGLLGPLGRGDRRHELARPACLLRRLPRDELRCPEGQGRQPVRPVRGDQAFSQSIFPGRIDAR
eukprot:UN3313